MKRIEDIEKLSAEDLCRIGADESVPVPEDLDIRLPRPLRYGSIAAAAAVLIGLAGWGLSRPAAPTDSFDDPYLAYAAVEQALEKMSFTIQSAATKVNAAEDILNDINYWK